jgi:hypothetical protein
MGELRGFRMADFLVVLIKDVPNQHMLSQVINIKKRLEAEV